MRRNVTLLVLGASLGSTLICAIICALATQVSAVSTRTFQLDTSTELASGELDGTAVHSDGFVSVGASIRRIALDQVPVAYSFAQSGSATYVGTGNEGKIYRLEGDRLVLHAETNQLLVSALEVGNSGELFAATIPDGKIHRVDAQGTVTEFAAIDGVDNIWDLLYRASSNTLFAATGGNGEVYSINRQGNAQVYWDSDAAHVMSLAEGPDGALLAGTSDDALVVRLTGPGRAEVIYDFPGNEITSIDYADGILAVAANDFPAPPASSATKNTKNTSGNVPRRPGKGRVWRVDSDGRAEQLYSEDDGHFTSVQVAADGVIFAGNGNNGRIIRIEGDSEHTTWIDVEERQILGLNLADPNPVFITGDAGAVYRVLPGQPDNAVWTSKALDADFISRFGQLDWRGAGSLSFQTRSGNREEPDATWTEWSQPITTPGPIRSPAARFIQLRARLGSADAQIRSVTAYYLPLNQRGRVHTVTIGPATKAKNDNADRVREPSPSYKLAWKIQNPDNDRTRYRIRFREESQRVWRSVLQNDERVYDTNHTWDTTGIPDGQYVVEIVASDEPANPRELALSTRVVSEPLLIDNHAPRIEELRAAGTIVTGRAVDSLGPIARLEFAVDGGEFQMFFPDDDFFDTARERFRVDVGSLEPGTHIVAIRALDAGGNPVTAEIEVTTP